MQPTRPADAWSSAITADHPVRCRPTRAIAVIVPSLEPPDKVDVEGYCVGSDLVPHPGLAQCCCVTEVRIPAADARAAVGGAAAPVRSPRDAGPARCAPRAPVPPDVAGHGADPRPSRVRDGGGGTGSGAG